MAFSIRCRCGQEFPVKPAQAGMGVRCACGKLCLVPSLSELTRHAKDGTVVEAGELPEVPPSSEDLSGPQPSTRVPSAQVMVLTRTDLLRERINEEALRHFITAMMREVEDFFAGLPKARGMDLRLTMALLPDGTKLVDIHVRPNHVEDALQDLRRTLDALPAPPVRGGPVGMLAHTLIWGGSDDPDESFRHPYGPYFCTEPPERFAAALAAAEQGDAPDANPRFWWERVKSRIMGWARGFAPTLRAAPRSAPSHPGLPSKGEGQGWAARMFARVRRVFAPAALPAIPSPQSAVPDLAQSLTIKAVQDGVEAVIEDLNERLRQQPWDAELYGLRGDWLQELGRFDLAVADYDELIARRPRHARAYVVRGNCHRRNDSMEKALADFNEAIWIDPVCAEALAERACIFFELGALDRAVADVAAAMEADVDNARLPMLRGRMFATQEKLDEAIEDFTLALRLDPHNSEAFFLRGQAYRDRRPTGGRGAEDNRAAMADLTAGLRLDPEHALGYAYRAETRLADDDLPGALADCEEALRHDADCALAYAVRGIGRQREDEYSRAIDDCSEAIQRGVDGPLVRLTRAEAYAAEAQWEPALDDCTAALETSPGHAGAHALRARIHAQLGSLDDALEDAEAAVRLAPEWHMGYGIRGNLHGLRGDHALAIEDLSEALTLEPADTMSRYNRAVAWCQQEEFDKAIDDFNQCIEQGASGAPVYFSRGNAWLQKGESDKARADLDEALRQDPQFAPAWFARGNLLMNCGEFDAAKNDFDELIRQCPTLAFAYAARANAWVQKGETEKAEEDYQEAIRLDPGGAEGYALQRLLVEADHHYRKEEYAKAVAAAGEAIELEPECAPAYMIRGAAWWCSEHQVEAAEDFSKLLELSGDSFAVYCNRGQVLAEMGEFERAVEDLDRALELGAKSESAASLVHALSGRALAYAGLQRYDEACRDFEQSVRDAAGNAWIYYNRALMHHGQGKTAAAVADFRLALESHDPALPPRKRDRARAYLRRMGQKESLPSGA